jgi:serine/threonine-protein kinase
MHKRLNQLVPTPIPGSINAKWPSFSPDGTRLVTVRTVFNVGALQTLPLTGGTPKVLVADSVLFGAAWGEDGYIYYSRVGSLQRIPEDGGQIDTLTLPTDGSGLSDRFPVPVPGGEAVLVARQQGSGGNRVIALDLATREERDLLGGFPIDVLPSGVLVYSPDGRRVNAVQFDLDRLVVEGEPLSVTPELRLTGFAIADIAVSRSGLMVYWSSIGGANRVLWVDRRGGSQEIDPEWPTPQADTPGLSPDGRRLALSLGNGLVVKQLDRGPASQIVAPIAGRNSLRPEWHPDGRSLLVYRTGSKDSVFVTRDDGIGGLRPTVDDPRGVAHAVWSPDGQWLVYRTSVEADNAGDIYAQRVDSGEPAIPLVTSPGSDITPVLSPDGRWLAYASDESGSFEIYLRPFPNVNDRRVQVSVRGGRLPRWARGSGELFFVGPENQMMAVRVRTAPTLELGPLESLFPVTPFLFVTVFHQTYDVTADGQRLVMIGVGGSPRIVRIDNWLADYPELQR